jgi:hypothetical protein
MGTKICSKCKLPKDIEKDFGKKKCNKDGLNHYCLVCERQRCKTNFRKVSYKEATKYRSILRNYGLTKEEYLTKLQSQNFACAICQASLMNDRYTHVDHDHNTGKVRDMLCQECNILLGIIENNVDKLGSCLAYLAKHSA